MHPFSLLLWNGNWFIQEKSCKILSLVISARPKSQGTIIANGETSHLKNKVTAINDVLNRVVEWLCAQVYSQREKNARIFQLSNEIENFKQASAPSENVPIPPTAAEIYAKIVEKIRVFQFLAGLNLDFEYARVHLLDRTPFPTLEEAHAYCLSYL
ncbi:hypothetical protein GIB67_027869 [Kingdonia uniflora]|uniref:Uncharacterized protein n=1 Tax=Kingdonia uniflora TaxID=39325 RepID=A0A7J7L4I6_9MAGN|nr:hypothetical protein GIB67_027869 [Kingdonia uniflora]